MYRRGEYIPVQTLMRMLAKHNLGRLLWSLSRNSGTPLFDKTVSEWTLARVLFCNWCTFYDNIYEAYNRPPMRVILDDEKIDEWLKFQGDQQELTYEENYSGVGYQGDKPKSAYSHDEVFEFK